VRGWFLRCHGRTRAVTLATNSTPKHVVPPYWEHGKVRMTDMNPGCKMYRAVYLVMDISSNIWAVSSDIVALKKYTTTMAAMMSQFATGQCLNSVSIL